MRSIKQLIRGTSIKHFLLVFTEKPIYMQYTIFQGGLISQTL